MRMWRCGGIAVIGFSLGGFALSVSIFYKEREKTRSQ
jgi:hypothetical protein